MLYVNFLSVNGVDGHSDLRFQVPEAGGRIQVKAQVALFVKTVFREGATPPYTRDDVATAVEYFTDVDPVRSYPNRQFFFCHPF